MYNLVMQIIAYIAIIWFTILVLTHIILYIVRLYKGTTNCWTIRRDSTICADSCWYIVPTFAISCSKTCVEVMFYWLKFQLYVSYIIDKDEE